ncbi:acyltransferase [Hymenobacter koreensis]|uniref:acyltransferase family protein n=1 Tax=Hymenobacter koreensis TaxID=1084523 RepID=UPI0031E7B623
MNQISPVLYANTDDAVQTEKSAKSTPKQHLNILDLLRGFAAISVCLYHYTNGTLPKISIPFTKSLFSWGSLGVDIFFVISGFIIPFALHRSNYTLPGFGKFMLKRIARICPPSYVVIILAIAQWWTIDTFLKPSAPYLSLISIPQLIHNFLYTIDFTGYKWINGVFWTLAIEFQFYIFMGLVFSIISKNKIFAFALAIIFTVLSFTKFGNGNTIINYGSLFIMGYITWLKKTNQISTKIFAPFLFFITAIASAKLDIPSALFGAATSLLIAYVNVKHPVYTFFGNISYSLYLTHILVGTTLEGVLVRFLPVESVITRLTILLICLVSAIIFSYLFYITIEKKFIAIANNLFR